MRNISKAFVVIICGLFLAACGSGGGNADGQKPVKAVAVMSTTSISTPRPAIAAISATLTFPMGVTVKTTGDPYQPAASVVQLVNAPASGALLFARYSAAASFKDGSGKTVTTPGKLKFSVIDASGFSEAEQIMINLDITPGYFPVSSDFAIINYTFSDINGYILSGITPTLSATIQ